MKSEQNGKVLWPRGERRTLPSRIASSARRSRAALPGLSSVCERHAGGIRARTASARVMLVGEQPGDHEDRAGKRFVGPAGQLLDCALDEAGIDRKGTYVTNAVKHFKWKARGTRRIHDKPS